MNRRRTGTRNNPGYTLVEILLAVAILGMITAIIVPRFNKQTPRTGIGKTRASLEVLRIAVRLYYEQEGAWPGADLTDLSDGSAPSGYVYLPQIPAEGITGQNRIVNLPDYAGGWVWETTGHVLRPNILGNDAEGTPYSNY